MEGSGAMIDASSFPSETGKVLKFNNVASFRKKLRQQDIQNELENL